jgi:hypothetical protein
LKGGIADWKAKRTLHAGQELQSETETNAATKETVIYITRRDFVKYLSTIFLFIKICRKLCKNEEMG